MKKCENIIDYLVVMVAPLCWAGDVVLARGISEIIPPFSLAFWRWTTAFFILLPFTNNHIKNDWNTAKKSWKLILLLSMLGMSIFISLIYTAVQTTTAINSALIQTTMPATIVLFCFAFYGEKISLIQLFGLSICFIGACCVVLQGNLSNIMNLSFVKGDILMILASILYGLYSSLLPKISTINPLSFLTLASGAGAIGLLPLYIYESIFKIHFIINLKTILGILYVGIFPSVIAYLCWNRGIATIGPNKTGIFINLVPVFASILAIIFINENIKSFHIAGMSLIFIGMLIFNKYAKAHN